MALRTLNSNVVAHAVRHQSTQQFRAVYSLYAERRWCLTGTPIQNRLEDLGSLIRFLRIVPFDNNATFRTHISEPLLTDSEAGDQNLRLLLRSVCLRRTRHLLDIPNAKDQTIVLSLSPEERTVYSRIIEDTKRNIDDYISNRSLTKAYNGILQAILRLRLLCNNGTQQLSNSRSEIQEDYTEDEYAEGGKLVCLFCSSEIVVSDELNDIPPSASPQNSSQLLCLACLSPNEINTTRYQNETKKKYATNSRRVQQINASLSSSPPRENGDHTSSTYVRPNILPNGHSSKLFALVSNIQGNMLSSKRYANPPQRLNDYRR